MKCSIMWCNRNHYAKGFCHAHYMAYFRFGSPFGKRSELYYANLLINWGIALANAIVSNSNPDYIKSTAQFILDKYKDIKS